MKALKSIAFLFLFFCLLISGQQQEVVNSNCVNLWESALQFDTVNLPFIDALDSESSETILNNEIEDLEPEVGILKKRSGLQIFHWHHFVPSEYYGSAHVRLPLLQHYTNLPPPGFYA